MKGMSDVVQVAGQLSVSRQLLDMIDSSRRVDAFLSESLSYAWPMGEGRMPFDRQLHWHGCFTWAKRGYIEDPGSQIAEDKYGDSTLWDLDLDSAQRQWVEELARWPRRYDDDC